MRGSAVSQIELVETGGGKNRQIVAGSVALYRVTGGGQKGPEKAPRGVVGDAGPEGERSTDIRESDAIATLRYKTEERRECDRAQETVGEMVAAYRQR